MNDVAIERVYVSWEVVLMKEKWQMQEFVLISIWKFCPDFYSEVKSGRVKKSKRILLKQTG